MATKKKPPSRKRAASKRTPKKISVQREIKKILFGIILLVFIAVFMAMIANVIFNRPSLPVPEPAATPLAVAPPVKEITKPDLKKKDKVPEKPSAVAVKPPVESKEAKEKAKKSIRFEIFDDVDEIVKPIVKPDIKPDIKPDVKPDIKPDIPRIAIIIDDIGYDRRLTNAFAELDTNLTFSILPLAPHGREIAEKLYEKGFQLMLHLPMEPMEYPAVNPGPGALLAAMSPDVLLAQLKQNLDDIPYILGVNNHMGSRITAISENMNQIFTILKKRDLFFIDSRTARNSQCQASARLLNLRFATRDVFLDNIQEPDYITGQLNELVTIALKKGTAIGIGHPYKVTLQVLKARLPDIKTKVELVPAKDLTAYQG